MEDLPAAAKEGKDPQEPRGEKETSQAPLEKEIGIHRFYEGSHTTDHEGMLRRRGELGAPAWDPLLRGRVQPQVLP